MAIDSPERRKGTIKMKVRRRISSKGKTGAPAGAFRGGGSRNVGSNGSTTVPSGGGSNSAGIKPDITPDFMPPEGGNWSPGDTGNDESDPASTFQNEDGSVDDKDSSNTQESSQKEPDDSTNVAKKEKGANPLDGQDSSGSLKGEKGFASNPDDGHWKNASREAGYNAGKRNATIRRKKGAIGIIGTIGVLASVGMAVLTIPGLALDNMLDKLTSSISDRATASLDRGLERFIGNYITNSVIPTLDACGSTLHRNCVKIDRSAGIAKKVTTSWNQNRIEAKLEDKHGITFEKDTRTNELIVKKNGNRVGALTDKTALKKANINEFIGDVTGFEGVRDRRHWRNAAKIYNAKWCTILCEKRDSAKTKVVSARKRLIIKLTSRVLEPANSRVAAYLFCIIDGCSPDRLEREVSEAFVDAISKADDEVFERIIKEIGDKKVSLYLAEKVIDNTINKVLTKTSIKVGVGAIPIAGWIYFGATITDLIDQLDSKIKSGEISDFVYDRNAAAAVGYSSSIISAVEDSRGTVQRDGGGIASTFASTSTFASVQGPDIGDVGGVFQVVNGYDQSRLYQDFIGGDPSRVECDNDIVIPAGSSELVCPENRLVRTVRIEEIRKNDIVDKIAEFSLNGWRGCAADLAFNGLPVIGSVPLVNKVCPSTKSIVKPVMKGIQSVENVVGDVFLGLFATIIPGFDTAQEFLGSQLAVAFGWVTEKAFPLSVNVAATGFKTFDQSAAGIDYLWQRMTGGYMDDDGSMQGLGGKVSNPVQAAEIDSAIALEKQEAKDEQGIMERYFDIENFDSLASISALRLSSILPFSGGTLTLSVDPLQALSGLSTVFGGNASATGSTLFNQDREAVFGNVQYIIPEDDRALTVDINSLESGGDECRQYAVEREETKDANGNYTVTDPCLFNDAVADMATKTEDLDRAGAGAQGFGSATTSLSIDSLTGPIIPCQGQPTPVVKVGDHANWSSLPPSGVIGQNSAGQDIKVYVREACAGTVDPRTVVIGSSIHGSENGGQLVSHELLFNEVLPEDVRVIAIPEINGSGVPGSRRRNERGVDLNRNWDYRWDTLTESKNTNPNATNYRGTAPESEPETRAVASFLRALGPVDLFISYHDNINWVAPVGTTPESFARSYSASTGMQIGNDGGFYVNQRGSMDGWFNQETGSPTLLVELTNERSESYINSHIQAVKRIFTDNVAQ
jgi:hypothetical protein